MLRYEKDVHTKPVWNSSILKGLGPPLSNQQMNVHSYVFYENKQFCFEMCVIFFIEFPTLTFLPIKQKLEES